MSKETMSIDELEQLKSFSSPFKLIKKALSSFFVVLMIGAGLVINWIMTLVYLFGYSSDDSWLWFFLNLILFIAVFPAVYLFFAYSYGQSVLIWEAYKEGIRPLAAKLFSSTLDRYLTDNPANAQEIDEEQLEKEVESEQKGFLDKLPDFIKAYVQIFFSSKDVLKIIREQRKNGTSKEVAKQKAMKGFFEGLDIQMSELMEPSLIPFYIVGAINLACFYFLF